MDHKPGSSGLRSKSNLSANGRNNRNIGEQKKLGPHITLERNGSLPNLNTSGNSTPVDKITQLHLEYDKYLSSLEAKYVFQMIEKKVTSNINEQRRVFMEEFDILRKQLETLSEELESINELKNKKKNLDKQIEVLELLDKTILFNESEKETMSLFTSTATKVVVKNFKKMDETDLNTVKVLLGEIIEPLKGLDYENKANARIQLKCLLLKVVMLTKELDKYKIKCEELIYEQESMKNYNSSLEIMKAQFGEQPDTTLLPHKSTLLEDVQKMLSEIEW